MVRLKDTKEEIGDRKVWFQNARAKWRRMMLKQEGSKCSADKGSPSPSVPPPASLLLSLPSAPSPPPPFPRQPIAAARRPEDCEDESNPDRQHRQRFLGGPAPSPLDRP
ncbi:hypothetical protein J437_LFUL010594 [Ladona fulva]|uniref:Uncharacterized protein n=1 Tax=Ladona fulva TaxID=123851 RepID=A0A8K0K956_LADFU|nr:hypothetical protein J437_LFUL010594 [Ladona fulva]